MNTGDRREHRGHKRHRGHKGHKGHEDTRGHRGTQGKQGTQEGTGETGDTRVHRGHNGYKGTHGTVRLWSVYVIFIKMCGSKIRTLLVQSCFLLIRPIVVFHHSPALPSPLSITRICILFAETININKNFAFSRG